MVRLRGTVFKRPNGTFTVQTEPIWDPKLDRSTRKSLGTFSTRLEAERVQLDYNNARADGAFGLPEMEQRRIRLDVYLTEWLRLIGHEQSVGKITVGTRRDYETIVRLHIVPHLGSRRIGDLTPATLHRWLLAMKAIGVGDRTVQKAHRTLHRALADADLKENPAKLPKRYRPVVRQRRPVVYPTVDEVNGFVKHVSGCGSQYGAEYEALWRVVATCGLRRGEVVGLAWSDVDFDGGTISIRQTIQVDHGKMYVKGPKSENGYRTIALDPGTLRQLHHHRTRMLEARARAGADYRVEHFGCDFVFRSDRYGALLPPDRITRAFRREWLHAGLQPGPTLHGLRHANGSLLLLDGVPPIHVAAHLGHDLQTLNNVYAHELDPVNRRAVIAEAVVGIYQ